MGDAGGLDAATGRRQRGVATAAASASPQPTQQQQQQQQQAGRADGRATIPEDAAALAELRRQMEAALADGRCGDVARLLPPNAAAATRWSPRERAALFDVALRACADTGDAAQARTLVAGMWRQGVPVGTVAHTAVLRALLAGAGPRDALSYLHSVATVRQRPLMYAILVDGCVAAGELEVARQALAMYERRRHAPDVRVVAARIRLLGAAGDAAAAEAAWREAAAAARGGDEAAALHGARVAAAAAAGELDAALRALGEMMDEFADLLPVDASLAVQAAAAGQQGGGGGPALPPAVRSMQAARNALLAAARRAGDAPAARRVAALATLRGLPPDQATYHLLLRAAVAHGDGLAAVQEGADEMRRLGMPPSSRTYSHLLRAAAADRDPAAAQAVLDAMPGDGVVAGRAHHNLLLQAYSRAGDLQGVDGAYRRMRAAGVAPDSATFARLLACIKTWAELEAAARAEGEGEGGLAPRGVERTMQRRLAGGLLASWVADLDAARPCQLTPALFTTLLHAYSQCGEIYVVLRLMRDALGCQLSPATARALAAGKGGPPAASGAGAAAGPAPAVETADSGSSSGGSSSSSTAGGAAAAGAAGGDTWPLRRRTLARAGLAPCKPFYNAAIGACTRVGRWHMADAVALLHSMLAAGLSPDVHTYTSLISGCAAGRQAALARELRRQMGERGISPTIVTHNALLKVELFTYGVDAGLAYLRRMVEQGVQPDRASWSTLLAAARVAQRGDAADTALEQLALLQQQQQAARGGEAAEGGGAAAAAGLEEEAEDDHQWHGYYEAAQEDEEEW